MSRPFQSRRESMARTPVKESPTEPAAEPAPVSDVEALVQEKTALEERLATALAELEANKQRVLKESLPATPGPRRVFVAPAHQNEKILVKAGTPITRPNPAAAMDMVIRRDGDIWARFQDGILSTEEPEVIAWCEAHSNFCRDAEHPQTRAWAVMTEAQMETSTQESRIPKNVDIGKLLEGDISALAPGSSIVDRARERV